MKTSVAALALFAAAVAQAAVPTYTIPAFDLTNSNEAAPLVNALKTTGIAALKNIPAYESTRTAYLQAAAECVSASHENVLHKRLIDGTVRRTLSTYADLDLVPESLTSNCPDYVKALSAFNSVIDQASLAFSKALDSSSADIGKAAEDIITKGAHLEHLHSYTNPVVSRASAADLSLEWHTDAGVLILMSAPSFFNNENKEVENPDENAGLIIMLNGTEYRPQQKAGELVVMVGQAFNEWTNLGHRFPPVLHAMVMPRSAPADVKRVFFGRMILPSKETTMDNTKMTFGDYTESTRRFLMGEESEIATFGCPAHRQLAASDASCTIAIWEPSNSSAKNVTKAMCMRDCNVDTSVAHMKPQFEKCKANGCVKKSEVANGGTVCWMVCNEKFSDDICPSKVSTCVDDVLVCQGGTVAPKTATTTAAPSSPTTTPKSSFTAVTVSIMSLAIAAVTML